MKLKKIFIFLITLTFLIGCGKKELTDSEKFKQEYEKYNDTNIELEIDEDNIITYSNKEEINKLIKEGTGIVFIGSPKDNLSRTAINILLQASTTTDIDKIYYLNTLEGITGIDEIENQELPIVLNILEGKIISYH